MTAPLMINENNNGPEIEIFLIFFSPSPLLAATKNFSREMICAQLALTSSWAYEYTLGGGGGGEEKQAKEWSSIENSKCAAWRERRESTGIYSRLGSDVKTAYRTWEIWVECLRQLVS